MIRSLIKRRGQSTLEYAILIVVVIMALVGMQAYLKRGLSGRMRDSADQIGGQFNPNYAYGNVTTYTGGSVGQVMDHGTETTTYKNQWQSRSGSETLTGNLDVESWM